MREDDDQWIGLDQRYLGLDTTIMISRLDRRYLGLDDFGSKVLWCSTQCPSAVSDLLRKTKVGDLKVLFSQTLP